MKKLFVFLFTHVIVFAKIVTIQSPEDMDRFFPKTAQQIEDEYHESLNLFKKNMESVLNPPKGSNLSLVDQWDVAIGSVDHSIGLFSTLTMISTNPQLGAVASSFQKKLSDTKREYILSHPKLYKSLRRYMKAQGSKLSKTDRYYLEEILTFLEESGLSLPEQKRERLIELGSQIHSLSDEFSKNIRQDQRSITVSKEDLLGLDEHFISSLERQENQYRLYAIYPTVFPVLSNCKVSKTRQRIYDLFHTRAYPNNVEVLEKLIALRDEYARTLNYPSYAHYQLQDKLIQSPERAQKLLDDLLVFSQPKEKSEFVSIIENLPTDVALHPSGKMYSHDVSYAWNQYKKKHINLDFEYISQYFPLDKSLDGLIQILQTFFGLQITKKPIQLAWSSDLILLEVQKGQTVLGRIILDLFPRPMKYSHACMCSLIPAWKQYPAMSMVLANFPKPTKDRPSLLTLDNVETLFHELGHALHDILGRSDRILTSGTNVKWDFVELPSQIMEEWLFEPEVLKLISSHYETKAPLSDALIEKIVQFKNCNTGYWLQRQIFFANLSLAYFLEGNEKDTQSILKEIHEKIRPNYVYNKNHHTQASFGHLTGYAATYYGYLFTKVLALDFFDTIKKEGILNAKAGEKYLEKVLSQGGRKDPNEIILDYLGREVSLKPFLSRLGLSN